MKARVFGLGILLVSVILATSSMPTFLSASPDIKQQRDGCPCVKYVTNSLFGRDLIVDFPSLYAENMAQTGYWDKAYSQYSRVQHRCPSRTAQFGDVIIMKSNAVVHALDPKTGTFSQANLLAGTEGAIAGHVGFVQHANYRADKGGWEILMRSAHWGGVPVASGADGNCPNVTDSWIFVPNGPAVTFWSKSGFTSSCDTPSTPPTLVPPVPVPVPTPVPPAPPTPCVPRPELFDPGNNWVSYAKNAIFRWRGYSLKEGEYFDVQVRLEGNAWKSLGGEIKQKRDEWYLEYNDLAGWSRGRYYWTVRVKRSDGSYATCDDNNPFSFQLYQNITPVPVVPGTQSSSSSSSSWWTTYH